MTDQNRTPDEEIHVDDDLARAGETSGHMRWVLAIGTVLAVIAMSLIWIVPALEGAR